MKIIKYNLCTLAPVTRVDPVTEIETEEIEEILTPATMTWSEENEEIAKKEAHNGEYIIEDDGRPEPETPSGDSVWDELDAAYQRGVDSV